MDDAEAAAEVGVPESVTGLTRILGVCSAGLGEEEALRESDAIHHESYRQKKEVEPHDGLHAPRHSVEPGRGQEHQDHDHAHGRGPAIGGRVAAGDRKSVV